MATLRKLAAATVVEDVGDFGRGALRTMTERRYGTARVGGRTSEQISNLERFRRPKRRVSARPTTRAACRALAVGSTPAVARRDVVREQSTPTGSSVLVVIPGLEYHDVVTVD
jgi:hypothetical protein